MCTLAWFVLYADMLPSPFALDQEPDDVIVARRCSGKALEKTSPGDIIGFAGDTVRESPLRQLCTAHPALAALNSRSTAPYPLLIRHAILSLLPSLL